MKRRRPEQALQREVVRYLALVLDRSVFFFHPANGGYRTPIEASMFVAMGVVAGVPDLILVHKGQTYGIELKAEGGRLTDIQRETHGRMRKAGTKIAIAKSLDEVIGLVRSWELPTRENGK